MLSLAKAFAFADTVGQIGQPCLALTNEVWWSPAWPFSSGYTSASSAQAAREQETRTGKPRVQTMRFSHAMVDLAVQAASRPGSWSGR
ncbi:hypothetical protein [Comamonas testosteroni]|uniref:hypothetical protein n=1 Tax=Comamonas testosteroni TaxID=285 RepID=UPI0015FD910A|nr:hypothetical protein [Comamonas testosteroni]WEE76080.1 hypothetical protein LZ683_18190 [Comamonas testosteroni]